MTAQRDTRFDTLKGFLILSVVFGHFFLYDQTHSVVSESITNFFYTFHMPLFVFLSGYFTNDYNVVRGGLKRA
ncbi:MAG: acyltransferase family protein, partial [Bacteroidales bacterium]|nr:acyltransferase family protein [Bacteroidales bacterium]